MGWSHRAPQLKLEHRVTSLRKKRDGLWHIAGRRDVGGTPFELTARFVFVGAGGAALQLLQKSGIKEIRGYGGFPISGEFLRTDDPAIVARHQAKVYGKAAVGAPPMSVPHLDTRVVDGTPSLLFGPYAGLHPPVPEDRVAVGPVRLDPVAQPGHDDRRRPDQPVVGLVPGRAAPGQLERQDRALQQFAPTAKKGDWRLITAGQRVQIMKRDADGKPVIQFGTEVVSSADGSIAGLLGASPGASTAVPIMLDVLAKCFPDRIEGWKPRIEKMIPSYGTQLSSNRVGREEDADRDRQRARTGSLTSPTEASAEASAGRSSRRAPASRRTRRPCGPSSRRA